MMVSTDSAFQNIRRPTVVEEVIANFKQALIQGKLHPGDRLPTEFELAQQFGVGRSAIREAMKMLAALGVVTIQQGDGTYIVDKPSAALLSPLVFAVLLETGMSTDIVELRSLIETGYCQLASQKACVDDWQRIEEAEKAWEDCADDPERDMDRWTHCDLGFHFAILDATHNALVVRVGRAVEEIFFASIRSTLSHQEWLALAVGGHRGIMEAMRTGDPELIRQAVLRSLGTFGLTLQESVAQVGAPDVPAFRVH